MSWAVLWGKRTACCSNEETFWFRNSNDSCLFNCQVAKILSVDSVYISGLESVTTTRHDNTWYCIESSSDNKMRKNCLITSFNFHFVDWMEWRLISVLIKWGGSHNSSLTPPLAEPAPGWMESSQQSSTIDGVQSCLMSHCSGETGEAMRPRWPAGTSPASQEIKHTSVPSVADAPDTWTTTQLVNWTPDSVKLGVDTPGAQPYLDIIYTTT